MEVTLTPNEIKIARFVAEQRDRDGINAGANNNKHGVPSESSGEMNYTGCLGEMAFAKAMNVYWTGAGDHYYEDSDVGGVDVRATWRRHGCLIVRPREKADMWVLAVVHDDSKVVLAGWITDENARDPRFEWPRNNRPFAFIVPQSELEPMEAFC